MLIANKREAANDEAQSSQRACISLSTWRLLTITVWFVRDAEEGLTLVDAGMGWMAKGIRQAVDGQLGETPLKRIVLTHGHEDHVGSLIKLKEAYPDVLIYANRVEIPYLDGSLPYPKRSKPVSGALRGMVLPLPEDDGRLLSIGGLQPYWTPGHSPGHTIYYHEPDRVVLAGDLFTSSKGRLKPPMKIFTPDMDQAISSSAVVQKLSPARIEVCHGKPVTDAALNSPPTAADGSPDSSGSYHLNSISTAGPVLAVPLFLRVTLLLVLKRESPGGVVILTSGMPCLIVTKEVNTTIEVANHMSETIYVGADIGGTAIKVGACNAVGDLLQTYEGPTEAAQGTEQIVENIVKYVRHVVELAGFTWDQVGGVGVGIAGFLDIPTGYVKFSNNLNIRNLPLKQLLEEKLEKTVKVNNDANVAALALKAAFS